MKLNLTYIILIILIIISIIYIIYKNIIENKQLEKFINRNSLSSYTKNNVDEDSVIENSNKQKMNQISNNIINKNSKWNGIWSYQDDILGNCECVILQINKHIIFSLSKKDLIIYSNKENNLRTSFLPTTTTTTTQPPTTTTTTQPPTTTTTTTTTIPIMMAASNIQPMYSLRKVGNYWVWKGKRRLNKLKKGSSTSKFFKKLRNKFPGRYTNKFKGIKHPAEFIAYDNNDNKWVQGNSLQFFRELKENKTVNPTYDKQWNIYNYESNNLERYSNKTIIEELNCPLNTFIGIGELNNDENLFYLKTIHCNDNNTFKLNDVNIKINHLTGKFRDDNSIVLTIFNNLDDINRKNIYLNKIDEIKYNSSAAYLLYSSYNVPLPILKDGLKIDHDICSNSYFNNQTNLKKCYIKGAGLPYLKNDIGRSSYGTGCSTNVNRDENNIPICSSNIENTCYLPINNIKNIKDWSGQRNYKQCNTDFKVEIKNQTSILQPIYKKNGGVLDLCKHLNHFQDGRFNASIIMYVDNLYNVETLSYNFFGIQDNQSALTTEYDFMFSFMNDFILKKYRDALVDTNTNNSLLETSLNLTNCLNLNDSKKNYQELLDSCSNKYNNLNNKLKNNIQEIINNNKLNIMPTIWNLDFNNPTDYTNSCSFTLSSSSLYEKESQFVKYPSFYPMKQKTKMNLYKGSNNQKLVLENADIIDSIDNYLIPSKDAENISNEFIIISGNLRTYQPKKYLLPSNESDSSNPFGNEIYLSNNLKSNGKWLIMGLNLNDNLNENNKTLIKTLNKIKNTINS